MNNFTLKVYLKNSLYFSNDSHFNGGTDLTQRWAFNHLFPDGYLDWGWRELLWQAADSHGWKVEVIELN